MCFHNELEKIFYKEKKRLLLLFKMAAVIIQNKFTFLNKFIQTKQFKN